MIRGDVRRRFRSLTTAAFYHPFITLLILLVVLVSAANWKISLNAEAYRNSPQGKAELARQAADDTRKEEERRDQSRIDVDLAGLKVYLRDPDSAQFSGTRHFKEDGKEITCGMVNSRNGFGGMSGGQSFAVVDFAVSLRGQGRDANTTIDKFCY